MDTTKITLNENWKFYLGECEGAWYAGFDDNVWQSVSLPHDWSVTQPFSKDYSSGTGYLAGGIGWYRLHFYVPSEYKGKDIKVVFDGIYKNSQIWCNSYYLGKRPNGYVTFSHRLTDFIHYGEENVLCVKVTHTDLADSRWFTGSGITRKVTLAVREPVHPAEYSIVFKTNKCDENSAEISVYQEILNSTDADVKVNIEIDFCRGEGICMEKLTQSCRIPAGEAVPVLLEGVIKRPELWSTDNPNLYQMKVFYTVNDKLQYLAEEEKVGIRSIYFSPDNGFFLNGNEVTIKGVCVHHDAGCLGAAVTAHIWQRRLSKLKECGCNAVRCSHNPHMPELYELCDAMGFLMMDEAFDEWENAKNKWSMGHNIYPPKHQGYFEDFPEWHETDLRAMVRKNRNHPSVILWSIGNEIDYPNDPYCHPMFEHMTGNNDAAKPAAERVYDANKPSAERLVPLAKRLAEIVKQEDPTRPVTMALAFPELSVRLGILEALDVACYNYKEQFYVKDHEEFPEKPFLGSENSHSYEAWRAVTDNPYISGQFLWTGIDYLGEAHGWPVHGSAAGLLNLAGFEKSRFLQRKALWLTEPVLELVSRADSETTDRNEEWIPYSRRWNYESGQKVLVMCYSNLSEIRLLLNGKEIAGAAKYNADGAYQFIIPFEAGILEAEGYDEKREKVKTTALCTSGDAVSLQAVLWKEADVLSGQSFEEASGHSGYLFQMEIRLLDSESRLAAADDRLIGIQVKGSGALAGIENGDLSDNTSYSEQKRGTKDGRLMVYIRRNAPGRIVVKITASGLEDNGLEVEVDKMKNSMNSF
ncbi:glycoside hydrolase family 2 TIM barrel-domain containing protein [Kineothrix sedimenti]|uniref:Glycoside hydrolase family 2 TIM barrel-domain containing protein n=1 Tax=Kineothrix sedimenti TaxID=3123317 RepID=A0ABZ3EUI7_9FIRM